MERLNTWQSIIFYWKKEVIPEEEFTPSGEFDRAKEEYEEWLNAHEQFEKGELPAKEAAMEGVDMLIRIFGYVEAMGFDVENLLYEKMNIIYQKYNPRLNGELRKNGYSWEEVLRLQKELWENKK